MGTFETHTNRVIFTHPHQIILYIDLDVFPSYFILEKLNKGVGFKYRISHSKSVKLNVFILYRMSHCQSVKFQNVFITERTDG